MRVVYKFLADFPPLCADVARRTSSYCRSTRFTRRFQNADKFNVASKLDRTQSICPSGTESNRYFGMCVDVHSCVYIRRLSYRSRESIVMEFQRKFMRSPSGGVWKFRWHSLLQHRWVLNLLKNISTTRRSNISTFINLFVYHLYYGAMKITICYELKFYHAIKIYTWKYNYSLKLWSTNFSKKFFPFLP